MLMDATAASSLGGEGWWQLYIINTTDEIHRVDMSVNDTVLVSSLCS